MPSFDEDARQSQRVYAGTGNALWINGAEGGCKRIEQTHIRADGPNKDMGF